MEWLLFALLTALFDAGKDALGKRLSQNLEPQLLAMALFWLTVPFLLPVFIFERPTITPMFWLATISSALLNSLATFLYMKSIARSDLSLVIPMIALSPVILLFTSPLMVGESTSLAGGFGVVLIAVGTWWLKREESHKGIFAPWHALVNDPGTRFMLGVALIWGVSANLDKVAVNNSSPLFYTAVVVILQSIILTVPVWHRRREWFPLFRPHHGRLLLLGGVVAAMVYCNMMAISLGIVPYAIAIKRSSVLLGVLAGVWFFGERGLKQRLFGATLMVVGMAVVVIGG